MFVGKISVDLLGQCIVASWFEAVSEETVKFSHNTVYRSADTQKVKDELGDKYVGILESFSAVKFVPTTVTMRQARLALLSANLLDTVDSLLTSSESKINWEYATEVYRNSTLVSEMQTALNLTDEQIDNLFIEASKL